MEDNKSTDVKNMIDGTFDYSSDKIRTAYALNLCTVSVSQIIDYDDIMILEQEYETILNNLNIERMPKDEALLNILKQLMDTITFFRIQEGDKKFIDLDYQNKMKNAIWSAVPNIGCIFAGDPITMAVSLVSQIGIGYMNYRRTKAENTFAYQKAQWQLQRAAIEQFNGLRRELFDTAWRLVDAHELPDEYRLTERQVTQYNAILMDNDDYRKYERLNTIKENFVAYPPFWYFFGNTANAIARQAEGDEAGYYINAAKQYYEIFIKSFQACNLLRENQIASACALEYIDLLDINKPDEKEKISSLLHFAIKMSGNAEDVLQLCAFAYLKTGDFDNAAVIFRRLVNENYNAVVNAQLLSGYYVSSYCKGNKLAKINYKYLSDRINTEYLFPMPSDEVPVGLPDKFSQTIDSFIEQQKKILIEKYVLVISAFRDAYRIRFNQCIPVPGGKKYTEGYYDGSVESLFARRQDGITLKNKKNISYYINDLQDCNYPYNYLMVLNDMINAVDVFYFAQGRNRVLVKSVSDAIIREREKLKEIKEKIELQVGFTQDTYNEILDISFDDYTEQFFEEIAKLAKTYIQNKDDVISMNDAESNLREFCINQGIKTPEELYRKGSTEIVPVETEKQYLRMELIDEGLEGFVIDDKHEEIKKKISLYRGEICGMDSNTVLILSNEEAFDRYFIKCADFANKREIQRKTVAVLDDCSNKDNDLLFTIEGITQVIKGKPRENMPYDKIKFLAGNKGIILRQNYINAKINMGALIQMIQSLQKKGFTEVKDKVNPKVEHIGNAVAGKLAGLQNKKDPVDSLIDMMKK